MHRANHIVTKRARHKLFIAIDRATRWVFIVIKSNKSATTARAFLKELHERCPIIITKTLTDNGKEFTNRVFRVCYGADDALNAPTAKK